MVVHALILGIALCCDYRIQTTDGTIGLNEVEIGIPVPEMWMKLMSSVIGQGKTDKLCQFAVKVPALEAKRIGLIDQVVETQQDLIKTSEAIMGLLFNDFSFAFDVTRFRSYFHKNISTA